MAFLLAIRAGKGGRATRHLLSFPAATALCVHCTMCVPCDGVQRRGPSSRPRSAVLSSWRPSSTRLRVRTIGSTHMHYRLTCHLHSRLDGRISRGMRGR